MASALITDWPCATVLSLIELGFLQVTALFSELLRPNPVQSRPNHSETLC